jgi:predicted acetyltransferase
MQVELKTARVDDKPVIANLLQLYLHDFSEFAGWAINEHGLFDYPWLDHYWRDPARFPFLIRVDGELAGFALVHSSDQEGPQVHHLAEFFVLRKFRRMGVGEAAARQLFDRMPGSWSVAQMARNVVAQHFWRMVIRRYTGGSFTERREDDRGRIIQEFTAPVG